MKPFTGAIWGISRSEDGDSSRLLNRGLREGSFVPLKFSENENEADVALRLRRGYVWITCAYSQYCPPPS